MFKNDQEMFGNRNKDFTETQSPRRQETVTIWLESDKEWNYKIYKVWETQRRSWREQEGGDNEVETEVHFGMVYSPPSDTKEGK